MTVPPLCPICSAESFQCDHEGLRWSLYAGEYEESPLAHDAVLLGRAVEALLKDCWARGRPPSDPWLLPGYQEGLELIGDDLSADDALFEISLDGTGYALEFFEHLPEVIAEDECESGHTTTTRRNYNITVCCHQLKIPPV